MSVKIRVRPLSVEEYLEGELHSEVKHELVGGQTYALVGASNIHKLIAGALFAALRQNLKGSPCRTFMSDMKVRQGDNFYCPDLVVTCQSATGIYYSVTDPALIVEVLSPTYRTTGSAGEAFSLSASPHAAGVCFDCTRQDTGGRA